MGGVCLSFWPLGWAWGHWGGRREACYSAGETTAFPPDASTERIWRPRDLCITRRYNLVMKRRTFLAATGTGAVALAGCIDLSSDDDDPNGDDDTANGTTDPDTDETLVVATYSAFLDAPSISPGEWVKEEFEAEHDAELVWQSPPGEINHYIQREQEGVSIDADIYLGLNTDELVRADQQLDSSLFVEAPDIAGADAIRPELSIDDPHGRALTFNTGYICPVYDSTQLEAPETFDGLLEPEYEGEFIAQNPATSSTGLAFMLHTIHHYGEEYLDFWADLQDNDALILGSWGDAYDAWMADEAGMVVSFSTDQVFASQAGADLDEHQIRFLEDQAYANPEGMAMFEGANEALATDFMEFILRPDVQGEIAQQNVVFPAIEGAEVPEDYDELAHAPPEPVTLGYEELEGNLDDWIDDWEREIVQ